MKTIRFLLFLLPLISFSQNEEEIRQTLDSIVKEADLLYNYEKAIWIASDQVRLKKDVADKVQGYIVYHTNDTVNVIFTGINTNAVAQYDFLLNNFESIQNVDFSERVLNSFEIEMINAKNHFIDQINSGDKDYEMVFYENYSPNLVLLPKENGYAMYIIMGTALNNVVPIGNDMLFYLDKNGKIINWIRFHNSLIVGNLDRDSQVISLVHSHLKMTPYITATDICTFRLYGKDLFGLHEISILSTALQMMFTYNALTNSVEFEKID